MDYELKEKMYMNEKDCVMGVVLVCFALCVLMKLLWDSIAPNRNRNLLILIQIHNITQHIDIDILYLCMCVLWLYVWNEMMMY